MKNYFENTSNANYSKKDKIHQQVINEAVYILDKLGIPISDKTPRAKEKIAMAFLAAADVKSSKDWAQAKDASHMRSLKSRDIIKYVNEHFGENISSGSYDDIRRKDLKLPVLAGIIIQTKPDSARNDPERGYALNPIFADVIRTFGTEKWDSELDNIMRSQGSLSEKLNPVRSVKQVPIILPSGKELIFSPGEHNKLIKDIVEIFLLRYGFGAEVLYVGDSAHKRIHIEEEKLKQLNFFELSHGELPDVVAYSDEKKWLFLIEAVYTSNPISPIRHYQLKTLTEKCKSDIIFVSAFPNRETFKRFVHDISWETEVWIADTPDHLIHFNGDKFLGPYTSRQ